MNITRGQSRFITLLTHYRLFFALMIFAFIIQAILHERLWSFDTGGLFGALLQYSRNADVDSKTMTLNETIYLECEIVELLSNAIIVKRICDRNTTAQGCILSEDVGTRCYVDEKLTLQAITRTNSLACKIGILRTACAAAAGKLYSSSTPSYHCNADFYSEISAANESTGQVRILFLIIVHGRDFRQFQRLIKSIYSKDHYYYIHVDKKSEYLFRKISHLTNQQNFKNIVLTSWRLTPFWGSSSFLTVLLSSIKDLTSNEFLNWKWDFFINLSGCDYPVKTLDRLTAHLMYRKGKNFISYMNTSIEKFVTNQGLNFTFYECDDRMWLIGKRDIPLDWDLYGGSDWFILSYQFCRYLATSSDAYLSTIKQFYRYTLLPAESFFHVVLRNSPFCNTIVYHNLRLINWKRKLGCNCQYRKIVDWCGCSPNVYRTGDIAKIDSLHNAYFARKFESVINQEVLNLIDERLLDKHIIVPNRHYYWQNVCSATESTIGGCNRYKVFVESWLRLIKTNISIVYYNKLDRGLKFFELFLLNYQDSFSGILMSFPTDHNVITEIWLQKLQRSWIMPINHDGVQRLYDVQVGSMLDEKEQLFRNHDGILCTTDDIVVLHRWKVGPKFQYNLTWYDPEGIPVHQSTSTILANWRFSYNKAAISTQIKPGNWSVTLSIDSQVFSEVQFFIFPQNASHKPTHQFDKHISTKRDSHDKNTATESSADNVTEYINHYRFINKTNNWIDSLVSSFWRLIKICNSFRGKKFKSSKKWSRIHSVNSDIPACEDVEWSSFTYDYKTEL